MDDNPSPMMYWFRLYRALWRTSVIRAWTYRTGFFIEVIFNSLWLVYFLFLVEIIFAHTAAVGGWSKAGAVILVGFWSLWDDCLEMLVGKGMRALSLDIDRGDFDLLLVRPVDAQALATFRQFDVARVFYACVDGLIIWYGVSLLPSVPPFSQWAAAFALLLSGMVAGYAGWVIMVSVTFRFIRLENIHELYRALTMLGRNPIEIFGARLRPVLFTIIPLALIAYIPAHALLGSLSRSFTLSSLTVALTFFIVSRLIWLRTLRRYSSASS